MSSCYWQWIMDHGQRLSVYWTQCVQYEYSKYIINLCLFMLYNKADELFNESGHNPHRKDMER